MRNEYGIEVPLSVGGEIENLLFPCCPFYSKDHSAISEGSALSDYFSETV